MPEGPREPSNEGEGASPPESIAEMIERAQRGEQAAIDRLFRRCYPQIRRLAHGRLPGSLRGEMDTPDLVQITFLRAWRGLENFKSRWEDAWLAYLRRILIHGARAAVLHIKRDRAPIGAWLDALDSRAPKNVVVVAMANKLARIGCAFQPDRAHGRLT